MSRNAILIPSSSAANLAKAETTIIAHLPTVVGTTPIPINGNEMSATQVDALIQSHIDKLAQLDKMRAELKAAVQDERALRASVKAAVVCVRNFVALKFGEGSAQFASLGFVPRKRAVTPVDTKAKAVVKSLATREARHTMGKIQKSKIFGTVPAAPAPAPAAPAPATPAGTNGTGTPSSGKA